MCSRDDGRRMTDDRVFDIDGKIIAKVTIDIEKLDKTPSSVVCHPSSVVLFGTFDDMNRVILKSRISNRIFAGHPWIYNNEIDKYDEELKGGDTVDVFSAEKKFIG